MKRNSKFTGGFAPYLLSLLIFAVLLLVWHGVTVQSKFDPAGLSEDELTLLEFNGDIIRNDADKYIHNPDKTTGFPGPSVTLEKFKVELSDPFHKKGANHHGVVHLIFYTVRRIVVGFLAASVVAIVVGVVIGLSKPIFTALNPYIQFLKVISPVAWMPLMFYSVKDPYWTAILVVFMASLWPTMANTAFGVNTMKKDYLQVASLLEMSALRRFFTVILPAAAPAIIAGLRISFGAALIAVVPVEMLSGELGIGYLVWMYWNDLDITGVIFALTVVGAVGFSLDYAFGKLAQTVSYPEI
jgi:nitrate/nitrite transport system permease protein